MLFLNFPISSSYAISSCSILQCLCIPLACYLCVFVLRLISHTQKSELGKKNNDSFVTMTNTPVHLQTISCWQTCQVTIHVMIVRTVHRSDENEDIGKEACEEKAILQTCAYRELSKFIFQSHVNPYFSQLLSLICFI